MKKNGQKLDLGSIQGVDGSIQTPSGQHFEQLFDFPFMEIFPLIVCFGYFERERGFCV
jgi:hypothetical protein